MNTEKQDRISITDKTREAIDFLTEQGYYVGNLWMTDDVVLDYPELTEDEAMWVLDRVLSSEWLTEQVFVSIGEHVELLLESKTNENE